MKNKIYSRKLILSFFLIIFALVAICIKLATFAESTDFIKWILGMYLIANTSESIGLAKKQNGEIKE